jgi:type I restriction enzyme S subunit
MPTLSDQDGIVNHVANLNKKITTAISLKQAEIEKLKEYKATLINSAVTGKINIG